MKAIFKKVRDELVSWWKNQLPWVKKVVLASLGATSLFFLSAFVYLCFKYPDPTRNLILLIAGLTGLYFLSRRTITAEQNMEAAQQSAVTAEKGLTTERFTRAIEQLASEKLSIGLGGILGLRQIVFSHREECYKIAQLLCAFVQDFAPRDSITRTTDEDSRYLDISEAVELSAKITEFIPEDEKGKICDLQFTNLSGLIFFDTDFSYFRFLGANSSNSSLHRVCFYSASLERVNFSGVSLREPKGLTLEQIREAFYWKGESPEEFPAELVGSLLEIEKPEENHNA